MGFFKGYQILGGLAFGLPKAVSRRVSSPGLRLFQSAAQFFFQSVQEFRLCGKDFTPRFGERAERKAVELGKFLDFLRVRRPA